MDTQMKHDRDICTDRGICTDRDICTVGQCNRNEPVKKKVYYTNSETTANKNVCQNSNRIAQVKTKTLDMCLLKTSLIRPVRV